MAYKIKTGKHKFKTEKESYSISEPRLEDYEGNQYSANPSDYFMMTDDKKFEGNFLVVTETNKQGWKRSHIIKENPSKKDLIQLNKKTKHFI
jgi:hypothetical protein